MPLPASLPFRHLVTSEQIHVEFRSCWTLSFVYEFWLKVAIITVKLWNKCSILNHLCPNKRPMGSDGKESACNAGYQGLNPWVGKIPWRREWQPTPVFLPGESRGQRYSPWGRKKLDTTEQITLSLSYSRKKKKKKETTAGQKKKILTSSLISSVTWTNWFYG